MTARNTWDSFWKRVEKANGCWLWTGTKIRGYGQFVIGQRRIYAHRVSYELAYGPIPKGVDVLHSCDNPPCVNPTHLRIGTHRENMADMRERGRAKAPTPDRMWQIQEPWRIKRGEQVSNAKANETSVREIRRRYADGEKMAPLAKEFGFSIQLVFNIVNRKSWKHVD